MKVFLSSTYIDLIEHRRAAVEVLERLGQHVGRMEIFGARPEEPSDACLSEIEDCDLFVGIYAHRYGHVPNQANISITEAEFRHAKQLDKPIFCFVVEAKHPWPPDMIESEPGKGKLIALKEAISSSCVRDAFTTPENLALRIATSVGRYLAQPSSLAEPDPTHLAIEAMDGTVWFGEEKYRNNGRFTVECNFYVLVGIEPVTLLSITGLYYAYGCASLSLPPQLISAQTPSEMLRIDHTEVSLTLDGELRPQYELPANRRSTINYFCSFRPPLERTQPADCDNGDLSVSISWRTASQLKTHVTDVIFRFTDTGIRQMEKADSLRQPPRVTDAELQAWYTEGKLTAQALEDLRRIEPWKRYMVAFSDNTTSWRGSGTGYLYASLLRELVGNRHKPEL
jgi:hypothetical protein